LPCLPSTPFMFLVWNAVLMRTVFWRCLFGAFFRIQKGGSRLPAPRSIARFNRRFTNRLFLRVAGYLPGFAIVRHVGRKSGRTYLTPVNAFRTDSGYIIALTYGPESDWVKNVLAAGSCELQTRGRRVRLSDPRIETDQGKGWAPLPVKLILDLVHAPQYLRLSL
jgi:deazaflavin-dependent oxidoreductase (nitroreductase family)